MVDRKFVLTSIIRSNEYHNLCCGLKCISMYTLVLLYKTGARGIHYQDIASGKHVHEIYTPLKPKLEFAGVYLFF